MINDDFNFTLDSSDFPVSIEEFSAYMDGNLSDDEMLRVSSVIEHDDTMQGVMDSMEQSELTFAEYGQEDIQLPEEITGGDFNVPEIDDNCCKRPSILRELWNQPPQDVQKLLEKSENSEREKLYFSAVNKLKEIKSLNDVKDALNELEKSSNLGFLNATSMINDIRIALYDIASHRPFIPTNPCN